MGEDVLEAEAIEEVPGGEGEVAEVRPLPDRAGANEISVWRGEVRSAAIAAAGGLVAGAATVAAVRATRAAAAQPRRRVGRRSEERMPNIVATRSFLIDVHLLER